MKCTRCALTATRELVLPHSKKNCRSRLDRLRHRQTVFLLAGSQSLECWCSVRIGAGLLVAWTVIGVACGSASNGETPPPPTSGDASVLVGAFRVRSIAPATTTVFGKVYDGPTPEQIIWEKKREDGGCALSEP